MIIALNDVFSNLNSKEEHSVDLDIQEMEYMGSTYPVRCSSFTLTLTNLQKGKARVEGNGTVTYCLSCDRCLRDTEVTENLELSYDILSPELVTDDDTRDEQDYIDGMLLNTDQLLSKEISLMWPMKVLCHDACKGICPVCGKNLNEGECGCDTFVPDPRMARLKDIFNQKREV